MQVIARSRQSLLDIAIQECGTIEAAFALASRNDISLTDVLTPGQAIEVAAGDISRKQVVAYLAVLETNAATAVSDADLSLLPGGLGYMALGIDFILG